MNNSPELEHVINQIKARARKKVKEIMVKSADRRIATGLYTDELVKYRDQLIGFAAWHMPSWDEFRVVCAKFEKRGVET